MNLGDYKIRKAKPQGPDPAEDVVRVGAEVIAQIKGWRADAALRTQQMQVTGQQLQSATLEAHRATAQAASNSLVQDQQRQLLEQGWDHAIAVLEQIQAARQEIEERAAAAERLQEHHAAHFPGSGFPGAVASVPNIYPGGKSELGFLYGLITTLDAGTLALTGGALTGDLTTSGKIGIGVSPTHALQVASGNLGFAVSNTAHPGSGSFGARLDKVKTDAHATALDFMVGGVECWGLGQDFDTNNSDRSGTGNSDFIVCYDYTAGYDDTGAHAFPGGADILRFTPAEKSNTGKSTQWHWSGKAANRNTTSFWGFMEPGPNQGGIKLSLYGTPSFPHLQLAQRNPANQYAAIDYAASWVLGQDIGGTNVRHFSLFDAVTTSARTTRFYVEGTNNFAAKFGFNTTSPQGLLGVRANAGAGGVTVIEHLFSGGYSGDVTNRSINLSQTSDGVNAKQFLLLNGSLVGTAAAPTLTSGGNHSSGFEATDAALSLVLAPGGTAQTIVRPLVATPVGDLTLGVAGASMSLLASNIALAGIVGGSASGSGQAITMKSATVTPGADADYTLTAAEISCMLLTVVAGSWTTGRNVIVPNTSGSFWHFSNSTGFALVVKTAGGTGITIANGRAAWIRSNGTNCRRMSADIDPST